MHCWRTVESRQTDPRLLEALAQRLSPLNIQFHKSKDLSNMAKMPAIYGAMMGEIKQTSPLSDIHRKRHLVFYQILAHSV